MASRQLCHEIGERPGVMGGRVDSFFGRLIHAAVGSSGGFGATPLKRIGFAAKAASSVTVRFPASGVEACIAFINPAPDFLMKV